MFSSALLCFRQYMMNYINITISLLLVTILSIIKAMYLLINTRVSLSVDNFFLWNSGKENDFKVLQL